MSKKIKLDLNELSVNSFITGKESIIGRGTTGIPADTNYQCPAESQGCGNNETINCAPPTHQICDTNNTIRRCI